MVAGSTPASRNDLATEAFSTDTPLSASRTRSRSSWVDLGGRHHLGGEAHHDLPVDVAHLLEQVPLHDIARRDRAVGDGELDGRHEHVALADAHVGHVAAEPLGLLGAVAEVLGLPLRRRDAPGGLAADVDAGGLVEAVLGDVVLHRGGADLARLALVVEILRDRVEHHVARVHDAAAQVERAVAGEQPALLGLPGVPAVPRAAARPRRVLVADAALERRQARERLVGGRRGILARDRAVEHGVVRLGGRVDVPHVLGNAADEQRRIERRIAAHRDDAAVADVHHDDRAAHAAPLADHARRRDDLLELAVDGVLDRAFEAQVQIGSARGLRLADHLDDVAVGVGDDAAQAVIARE